MIKLEKTEVLGWEAAIRGMRNPMNSWDKSDSNYGCPKVPCKECPAYGTYDDCNRIFSGVDYTIGPNDHELMMKLAKGGAVHAKYRRMIQVYVDITAPLYWWKEFDTYKVGTVANSCSTMHKIHAKEFTLEDFSCEHLKSHMSTTLLKSTVAVLNTLRNLYLEGGDCLMYGKKDIHGNILCDTRRFEPKSKEVWNEMIQLLPSSYNQKRTINLNYEVLVGMYRDRKNHKLDEWHALCKWVEGLPYSELITGGLNEK